MEIHEIIKENPCGMSPKTLKDLAHGIISLFRVMDVSLNTEQVARYMKVDPRTIRRWRKEYDDFPQGKRAGDNSLSFPAEKIVEWKFLHRNDVKKESTG